MGGWENKAIEQHLQTRDRSTGVREAIDTGHVFIWPGRAIYLGPLLDNDVHAHHAVQISIALEHRLSLQAPPDLRWRAFRAVASAPDQPHRLRGRGPVAQIYLDPESASGLAIRQQIGESGIRAVDLDDLDGLTAALCPGPDGHPSTERLTRLIHAIAGLAAPDFSRNLIDPRVQQTLTTVRARPGRHVALRELADRVALTPSRLGALFRRDIGIPIRRYLLWLRLIDAIEALSKDTNLTRVAHDAGFADSAHLSRTFHRMFGMPPSALRSHHVEIHDLSAGSPAAPWWRQPSSTTNPRIGTSSRTRNGPPASGS